MLQISDDNQKEVDKRIQEIKPGIPKVPYPYEKNGITKKGIATVYTNLRNEVGHKRPGVKIEETLIEIQKNLPDFREIVKECISRHMKISP